MRRSLQKFFTHIRKVPHFDTRFGAAQTRCGSPQKGPFCKCAGKSVVTFLLACRMRLGRLFFGSKRVSKWGIFLISINIFCRKVFEVVISSKKLCGTRDLRAPMCANVRNVHCHGIKMAEGEGFEPSERGCRSTVFKTAAFDHSATPPTKALHHNISFWAPAQARHSFCARHFCVKLLTSQATGRQHAWQAPQPKDAHATHPLHARQHNPSYRG